METFSDDDLYEFEQFDHIEQFEQSNDQFDHEFYYLNKDDLAHEFDFKPEFYYNPDWNPDHNPNQSLCAKPVLPFIEIDDLLEILNHIDTLVATSVPSMAQDQLKTAICTLDDIARKYNLLDSQKSQVANLREKFEAQMRAFNKSGSSQKKKKKKSPAHPANGSPAAHPASSASSAHPAHPAPHGQNKRRKTSKPKSKT